ncbi:MAG TPA: sulfatase-like hydrolase/transferase [Kofleriaceae bacterium]|nr:sulfatase-like hydrolase/transferase [Kofleriaceae bacterium]
MRRALLRCWIWLSPAIAIAVAAAIGAALVEGAVHGGGVAVTAIGAGEGLALVAPAAALALSLARGIGWGWRPAMADAQGTRVLAELGVGAATIGAVFAAGYACARLGADATKLGWLAAMIAGAGAAAAAALALAVAPLLVRAGGWLIGRTWRSVTPRRALLAVAIAAASLAIAGWWAARPLLVRYDFGLAPYGAGFAAAGAAATAAVTRWRAARAWIGAGALIAGVAAWSAARLLAASDATALLDAWSRLPVGGQVLELRRDVGALRAQVVAAIPALAPRADRHPDILIVTVDALRADRVTPSLTPALHAFGSEAAVFDRAYAPSTVTRGSLPSIMTSLSPGRIRGRLIDFALKLDPRHVLLAERLQRAGYTTRGFLCCAHHFGGAFDLGLDRGLAQVIYNASGEHLAHAATTFFADPSLDGAPRFGWLHTYEPHLWGQLYAAALYGAAPGPRYDRTVATVDRVLAPLLAAIRARGRPTIIAITADHGEGLGDHGALQHAAVPYTSQIHVPLMIAAPGVAPRRIATTVGLIGLGDTLLELAGFSPSPSDGPSFARLLSGAPPPADAEAYSVVLHDRVIPFTAHSLVAGDHHLIEVTGQKPELYDLLRDPGELTDLAAREPARLAELVRRLAAHRARDRVPPPF